MQNRTDRTGQPERDSPNVTARAGPPEQDKQTRTDTAEQDCQYRMSGKGG